MFLEREEEKRGICNIAYIKQVLNSVIRPYYNSFINKQKEEFIYIKDEVKEHLGKARL